MSIGMNYELAFTVPGVRAAVETTENVLWWGRYEQLRIMGAVLDGSTRDLGNTPTSVCRQGMLLGKITATNKLAAWDPTASDGTEHIYGVLMVDMNMTVNNTSTDRFVGPLLVGGPVKASAIFRSVATLGVPGSFTSDPYEQFARLQMKANGRFWFDDDIAKPTQLGFSRIKAAADLPAYSASTVVLTADDDGTLITNTGATGSITVTLPALAGTPASGNNVGFHVGIYLTVAQDVVITNYTTSPASASLYSPGVNNGTTLTVTGAIGAWIDIYGIWDKTAAKWLLFHNPGTITTENVYGGNGGTAAAYSAGATQTQAGATQIAAICTLALVTTSSGNDGVALPDALYVNQRITVYNLSAAALKIYPKGASGKLNNGSVTVAKILAASCSVDVVAKATGVGTSEWYCASNANIT